MKILVIRLSAIGDIIITTPILEAIKFKYPNSTIDYLVLDNFKASIEGNPYVDNLIIFDKKTHNSVRKIYNFGKLLKANKYDYIFDLHSKIRSILISFAMGTKTYRVKKRPLWQTILVNLKLINYNVKTTTLKNYFNALKDFDLEYRGENLLFSIYEKDIEALIQYKDSPIIAPGSSKLSKNWSKNGFAELIELIYHKYKKTPILIGSANEIEMANEINSLSGNKAINLVGKLTLKETGALCSISKFVVCNDSGPFHISRGVKAITFAIFGPTSPKLFELSERDTIIVADENLMPSSISGDNKRLKENLNRMNNLKAKKVFDIITNKVRQ